MNAALRSAGFSPLQRQVCQRDVGLFLRNYREPDQDTTRKMSDLDN